MIVQDLIKKLEKYPSQDKGKFFYRGWGTYNHRRLYGCKLETILPSTDDDSAIEITIENRTHKKHKYVSEYLLNLD